MKAEPKIVEVQPFGGFNQELSYGVPVALVNKVQVGCLVRITLGNRRLTGMITSLESRENKADFKLKFISSLVQNEPVLNLELIQLARWMCTYYYTSIESVLEGMIPAAVKVGMSEKKSRYLIKVPISDLKGVEKKLGNSPQQKKLFSYIQNSSAPIPLNETLTKLGIGISSANGLVKKQLISEVHQKVERSAYDDEFTDSDEHISSIITLTDEQQISSQEILQIISENKFRSHLLQGVTGSGKTEVYFQAMEETLSKGGGFFFSSQKLPLPLKLWVA